MSRQGDLGLRVSGFRLRVTVMGLRLQVWGFWGFTVSGLALFGSVWVRSFKVLAPGFGILDINHQGEQVFVDVVRKLLNPKP